MSTFELRLDAAGLSLPQLRRVYAGAVKMGLDGEKRRAIEASRRMIDDKLAADEVVYGVNTGFGRLAQNRISGDQLGELQLRLVESHAAGVGSPLADAVVRLAMVLKVASLARGYSGVRPRLV
ncbi:MAG: aromatic amino acid lyase, partial [Holophagales bacterium]|nr:aromatic amino acid lyase [Holophagales bacterium]